MRTYRILRKCGKSSFLKRFIGFLLLTGVTCVLVAAGFFFFQVYSSPLPSIKKEFQQEKEIFGGTVSNTNALDIWWISDDGLHIINPSSSGVELYVFNCQSDVDSRSVFQHMVQLIGSHVDKIMISRGFTINQKNSSMSVEDDEFYDYIRAYEKGALKAVFIANPDCGSYSEDIPVHYAFSFGILSSFDVNYMEQAPYLRDLGIHDAVVRVWKKAGDFVYLNVNYRRSGHYTIAKQVNGIWTELFSGQDMPSCKVVEENQIPKEIVSDCYQEN